MSIDPTKILLLGVKGTVIAWDQKTGTELWRQPLKAGMVEPFVTVMADTERVYAHTHGELFCLDLVTGSVLWKNGLSGLGYGIGSLAIPGQPVPPAALTAEVKRQQAAHAAAASSGTH
jgi:outer membrane protein assembly factor BamB